MVLGKREEGGKRLLQLVFSYYVLWQDKDRGGIGQVLTSISILV